MEQELFNIFTFYTLHGSAKDPERMTATQFKNFARDVQLPSTVLRADLDVLFRRVLSSQGFPGLFKLMSATPRDGGTFADCLPAKNIQQIFCKIAAFFSKLYKIVWFIKTAEIL